MDELLFLAWSIVPGGVCLAEAPPGPDPPRPGDQSASTHRVGAADGESGIGDQRGREKYAVHRALVYAGGISQGGLKTLLLIGRNPGRFAAALSINPVVDFLALIRAAECQTVAGVKQLPRASVLLQTQQ